MKHIQYNDNKCGGKYVEQIAKNFNLKKTTIVILKEGKKTTK
jgi:hypothetical protein